MTQALICQQLRHLPQARPWSPCHPHRRRSSHPRCVSIYPNRVICEIHSFFQLTNSVNRLGRGCSPDVPRREGHPDHQPVSCHFELSFALLRRSTEQCANLRFSIVTSAMATGTYQPINPDAESTTYDFRDTSNPSQLQLAPYFSL